VAVGGMRRTVKVKSRAIYKMGYRAETKAREILKEWGYTVIRSAKSGGPWDLVGYNPSQFILIQVKLCRFGRLPSFDSTKKELAKIQVPANAKKELWVYERYRGFHYFPI